MRREDVHDAVDGLRRVVGVQRREHEVPRLRRRQRCRDGLRVAHLANQNHVGVLPQDELQRLREAPRVGPHLALLDGRGAMDEGA